MMQRSEWLFLQPLSLHKDGKFSQSSLSASLITVVNLTSAGHVLLVRDISERIPEYRVWVVTSSVGK